MAETRPAAHLRYLSPNPDGLPSFRDVSVDIFFPPSISLRPIEFLGMVCRSSGASSQLAKCDYILTVQSVLLPLVAFPSVAPIAVGPPVVFLFGRKLSSHKKIAVSFKKSALGNGHLFPPTQ